MTGVSVTTMTVFPYTAPRFTPEDEAKEQAALSQEERDEILDDLYGRQSRPTAAAADDDKVGADALHAFARAVDQLPANEKVAYEQAVQQCPRLVQQESNPVCFLKCERMNVEKAANRFVRYWDLRKALFGEKAFLPMTLDGALRDDLETMKQLKHFLAILPEKDAHGRTIALFDKTEVNFRVQDRWSVTRYVWYFCHVLLELDSTLNTGVVAIATVRDSHPGQFDRKQSKFVMQSLTEAIPVPIKAVHYCHPTLLYQILYPALAFLFGKKFRQRFLVHKGSQEVVLATLESYGIPKASVPVCLGGAYEIRFDDWLAERQALEQS